jgi:hypothetical protein
MLDILKASKQAANTYNAPTPKKIYRTSLKPILLVKINTKLIVMRINKIVFLNKIEKREDIVCR